MLVRRPCQKVPTLVRHWMRGVHHREPSPELTVFQTSIYAFVLNPPPSEMTIAKQQNTFLHARPVRGLQQHGLRCLIALIKQRYVMLLSFTKMLLRSKRHQISTQYTCILRLTLGSKAMLAGIWFHSIPATGRGLLPCCSSCPSNAPWLAADSDASSLDILPAAPRRRLFLNKQ